MQQYYLDAKDKEEHVARIVTYCARKDVIDEIHDKAHSLMDWYNESGEKIKTTKAMFASSPKNGFRVFVRETGEETDMYMLTVIWREQAYINGRGDSIWHLYGKYKV